MSKGRMRLFTILNTGMCSSLRVGFIPLHRYRPEDVEPRLSCGDHHAGDLRVPVDLLDLRLPLVQEQELGRQVLHPLHPGPHVTRLHRQVPLADHVVGRGGGEHAGVRGAPLHRGDGGAVLLEVCNRTPALQVKPRGVSAVELKNQDNDPQNCWQTHASSPSPRQRILPGDARRNKCWWVRQSGCESVIVGCHS